MRIGVLGTGQVGGSILLGLRALPHVTVSAWDADPATRSLLIAAGVDVADPADLLTCDVLVLALPTPAALAWLADPPPGCTALVTDACSVTGALAAAAHPRLRHVGGHPMAGTEGSGWTSARSDMFTGAPWALVVDDPALVAQDWLDVAGLVTGLGARVIPVGAQAHDEAVGLVSHLPHVLTAAYGDTLTRAEDDLALVLGASSFDDFTRVSTSPGQRTADLLWHNRAAVRAWVAAFRESLDRVERTLDEVDGAAFAGLFTQAGAARRRRDARRQRWCEPATPVFRGQPADCLGWLRAQGPGSVAIAHIEDAGAAGPAGAARNREIALWGWRFDR